MLNIPEVSYVWYFKAPYGSNPLPRIIPEGQQDIEVLIAGRGFFEYEGKTIEALPGTLLWHAPGDKTIYLNDFENPYECIVITLNSGHKPMVQTVSNWADKFTFKTFIDNVLTEYHSETRDMEKLSYYTFGQLYWHCRKTELKLPPNNKRDDEIQRVISFIDNHYHEDINIGLMAKVADISVPRLHVVFKELIHQTPYQFLQAKRILEAKKLLATTRLSIKEVCARTGFMDVGNFCRLFKKIHNLTALEYRLLHEDKR